MFFISVFRGYSSHLHFPRLCYTVLMTTYCLSPQSSCEGERAAKRQKKSQEEKVDVNALWEEMKCSIEQNESDDENENNPPSPEDWHSHLPNVRTNAPSFTILIVI